MSMYKRALMGFALAFASISHSAPGAAAIGTGSSWQSKQQTSSDDDTAQELAIAESIHAAITPESKAVLMEIAHLGTGEGMSSTHRAILTLVELKLIKLSGIDENGHIVTALTGRGQLVVKFIQLETPTPIDAEE